jgi:regulator of PEP synthase PpsR (kinase-PPPase family)
MKKKRTAFFISNRTGLTAETLGRGLLAQFEGLEFQRVTLPYVETMDQAHAAVARINVAAKADGVRPLLFSTLLLPKVRAIVAQSDALMLDLFEMFIAPLETELGMSSAHAAGRSHRMNASYAARMEAVNYALSHDDGGITRNLARADLVLIGVSRCGKTPTSLYLALQFGLYTANYPLVAEDLSVPALPVVLKPLQRKLFGLTIRPERLQQIRAERASVGRYAELENCRFEVMQAERLMRDANVPYVDVSAMSVEEIATTILHRTGLRR